MNYLYRLLASCMQLTGWLQVDCCNQVYCEECLFLSGMLLPHVLLNGAWVPNVATIPREFFGFGPSSSIEG
jgi:hypothetical protein